MVQKKDSGRPSRTSLGGEDEDHSRAQRESEPGETGSDSGWESLKSNSSKEFFIDFKSDRPSSAERVDQDEPESDLEECSTHQEDKLHGNSAKKRSRKSKRICEQKRQKKCEQQWKATEEQSGRQKKGWKTKM